MVGADLIDLLVALRDELHWRWFVWSSINLFVFTRIMPTAILNLDIKFFLSFERTVLNSCYLTHILATSLVLVTVYPSFGSENSDGAMIAIFGIHG